MPGESAATRPWQHIERFQSTPGINAGRIKNRAELAELVPVSIHARH